MREFSVPAVAEVGDYSSLTDSVWNNAREAPDAVQFTRRTPAGWQDVTCAEFRDEVIRVAAGLIATGIAPGDRVALMSKTRYEWTLLDYALWAAGAVSVPIYETSSAEQARWILSDSGATVCIVETDAHAALIESLRGDEPELRQVWQIDAGAIEVLVAAGREVTAEQVEAVRRGVKLDDLATVIYTSGTTGRPKGCMITHRNLFADMGNAIPGLPNLFREGASTLLFLPLAHSFARLVEVGIVHGRCRMGHTPDVKNLVADLIAFRPTFVLSVPRVFEKVYNTAKQVARSTGKGAIFDWAERVAVSYSESLDRGGPRLPLRLQHKLADRLVYTKLRANMGGECTAAISGGAPLGNRLAHFFRGVGLTIFEGYGLTEASPVVAVNLVHAMRIGTVGQPLPGVTVRIADDGEILVKGDVVFAGYWKNPEATAEILDEQGWLHSGDLGELDVDGYLRITGRKKEVIVTAGGKNVAPAVLEDRLRAHPLVGQCMVVGDRQPFVGVLVTIDPEVWPVWLAGHSLPPDSTVEALRNHEALRAEIQKAVDDANEAVSHAEAIKVFRILPRDWSEATGEITPSLKVKRSVVLKEYADEIAAIYAK